MEAPLPTSASRIDSIGNRSIAVSSLLDLPPVIVEYIIRLQFEDDDVTLWRLYKTCKALKNLAWNYLNKRSKKLQEAATAFIQNKKPYLAYQILTRALDFTPKNSNVFFTRASCYQSFDGSRWDCLKGMELEPYSYKGTNIILCNPVGYFLLGKVYQKWSKVTQAYICYKKAASIHSSNDIITKVDELHRRLFSRTDDTHAPTLFEAIKLRSLQQTDGFLRKNISVNEVFPSGLTPLAFACQLNYLEFVEHLITKGARVNENDSASKLNAILTLLDVYTHKKKMQEDAQLALKASSNEKRGINYYDVMRSRDRGVEDTNSESSAHDELNNMINNKCRSLLREWSNELIFKELVNNVADKLFMQNHKTLLHKGIATGNIEIVRTQISSLQYGLHSSTKATYVKQVMTMTNHEGHTPLHEAVATNVPEMVQLILDTIVFAADTQYTQTNAPQSQYIQEVLSVKNNRGMTPFLFACTVPKIKLEIILMLLNFHCDINVKDEQNRNCFLVAATSGNYHILEAITDFDKNNELQLGGQELASIVDSDGNTVLHHALTLGFNKLSLQLLPVLKQHMDVHTKTNLDGMTPLMNAVSNPKISKQVLQELILVGKNLEFQNAEGNTALHIATLSFNFAAVALLIANGADTDARNRCGTTSLSLACSGAVNESVAWLLLSSGAQMIPNQRGITPLMMACEYGLKGLIEMLLKHGADVNAQDSNGYSALHRAVESGHHMVIPALARAGANLDAVDKRGYTPLHLAIFWGNEMCCRFLIDLGCNVQIKTSEGQDTIQFAVEKSGSGSYILAMLIEVLGVIEAKYGDISIIPVRNLSYILRNVREYLIIMKGNAVELILSKKLIVVNEAPKKVQKYDEELLAVLGEKFLGKQDVDSHKSQEWTMVTPSQFRGILDLLQEEAIHRDINLLQVVELWRYDEQLREHLKVHIEETIWDDPE